MSYNTNWPETSLEAILALPPENTTSTPVGSEVTLRWVDAEVTYSVVVQLRGDGVRLDYDYAPGTGNGQRKMEDILDREGHFSWAD